MSSYQHPDSKFFEQVGEDAPTVTEHGTDDDIRSKLESLMPNSWHLEGNKLIGMTAMGELAQYIPTDYILVGTSAGLPEFKRIVL